MIRFKEYIVICFIVMFSLVSMTSYAAEGDQCPMHEQHHGKQAPSPKQHPNEGYPMIPKTNPQIKQSCNWKRANVQEETNQPAQYFLQQLVQSDKEIKFISEEHVVVDNVPYKKAIYQRKGSPHTTGDLSILYADEDVIVELKWYNSKGQNFFWNNKFYDNSEKEPYVKSECSQL